MGFPQSQGLAGANLPVLARRGFARAKEAFGMGMSYNGAVLQQQALQAMGMATGGGLSVGTGRAGSGVGGGFSMGNGGGFGQANTASTIPDVDSSYAEINPAQYWGALSQSVSASGADDAPVVQPTPQPIKPNFTPYNNGDMRTQGDWNAISGDHSLKNNPADWKAAFGSHNSNQLPWIGQDHASNVAGGGWVADNINGWGRNVNPLMTTAGRYDPLTGKGSPYIGGQSPGVYNSDMGLDPIGYQAPHTFPPNSKYRQGLAKRFRTGR